MNSCPKRGSVVLVRAVDVCWFVLLKSKRPPNVTFLQRIALRRGRGLVDIVVLFFFISTNYIIIIIRLILILLLLSILYNISATTNIIIIINNKVNNKK